MKVISIRQPWASLIAKGYKEYEFRSYKTKYRGEILIHAGKAVDAQYLQHFKDLNILDYPTGAIIAKANITDCIEVSKEFEDKLIVENECVYGLSKGRNGYAFKLENVQEIPNIKINGKLRIMEL